MIERLRLCLVRNPTNFSYKIEYFYSVIRYLTLREIQRKNDEYFFINSQKLALSTVSNIASYIKYLSKWGIIETGYSKNNKPIGYRINPELLQGVVKVEIPVGSKLFDKIVKAQRNASHRKHANRLEPHIKKLYDLSMSFEMDYQGARNWINENAENRKLYYYHTMLDLIQDKRFRFFKRSKNNSRITSNLSTLKKELRQFLIGDWVQIDLKNSQPFFLSHFLHELGHQRKEKRGIPMYNIPYIHKKFEKNLCKEFGVNRLRCCQNFPTFDFGEILKFKTSCTNGIIYEDFLKELGDASLTRNDAKGMMLPLLYSNNTAKVKNGERKGKMTTPYYHEKKNFKKAYPTIYNMLVCLKHRNNSILPTFMQSIEAYVFLDCIALELINMGIIPHTVHDSVIVPANQAETAIKIIRSVFQEIFGLEPKFEIDNLKKVKKQRNENN